ncbi:MAG: hypothetical protein A2Z77_06265 [Chloroflexi bacterium RBG_13_51_36]|nr:MAG: hypothetical protein A2Z77_06265 [Chloroflexi bacterium RBG_13_51_36]
MNDAIIGGAIAAVIGLVGGFVTGIIASVWQERRREKAQRLAIVDALIVETAENLITCKDFETLDLWWTRSFKLEAYEAYKSNLLFLDEDVRLTLADAVFRMRHSNTIGQIIQQATASGHAFNIEAMPTKLTFEQLESVNKGLRRWRVVHSRTVAFRIRRRLRNLVSKIRSNSKLNHS